MKKSFYRFVSAFFLFSALLLYASLSLSAIYYVDATNGNDSNNAFSPETAWGTIAKVNASIFNPGDQILFKRGGVWREQLVTPSSGTSANPITFGAYGTGNKPVITGLNLVPPGTSWILDSGNIWKVPLTTQPKVVGFDSMLGDNVMSKTALNSPNKWCWNANVLYIYSETNPNTAYKSPGIQVGVRANAINITKNYITLDNLEVQGANTSYMGNVHMESDGVHHFIMQNCESKWGNNGFAIGPGNGGSNIVKNSTFHHNVGSGIMSDTDKGPTISTQNYFQNNEIYNNLNDGVVINANNWIVENNAVHDNGIITAGYIGIHLYTNSDSSGTGLNNIIRYNKVYNQIGSVDNDGAGISIDWWCDNNQVYYNVVYNCAGPGIYTANAVGSEIYNNTLYGNCQDDAGGLVWKGELRITNSVEGGNRSDNIKIKNNTVYATKADTYAIYVDAISVDRTLDITNNNWYAIATNWYFWGATGGNNLATWNGFPGVGTDLNSDPKFINPGTDFHLQVTSPCINAGTAVGLIQDYEGNSINGAVDIGAYEYNGKPQPPARLRIIN